MITIYKTPTCGYCPMVAKLFDMKGVKYNFVDVSENPELRQEVITKSGAQTVPITVVGDWEKFVVGWQPGKLMELINAESNK